MSSLRNTRVYENLTERENRDFLTDVAMGRVPGYTSDFMTGWTSDTDPADGQVSIFDFSHHLMVHPTGLVDVFVTSDNAADTTMSVVVVGVLDDYEPIVQTIQLNGTTPVQLPTQMRYIQSARMLIATPLGNVFVTRTNDVTAGVPNDNDDILSYITQGENFTHNAWYIVPKGKSAMIVAIRGNTDSDSKPALVKTYICFPNDIPLNSVSYTVSTAFPQLLFPTPVASTSVFGTNTRVLPEGTLVEYKVESTANNTQVFFGIDVILADNGEFGDFPIIS